ncbi:MAG: mechanosensitive ion channel [Gammaproteobacteria bacterium]|nr:mechanosensitive ion channel [Gammaproteobacteria bacterium]
MLDTLRTIWNTQLFSVGGEAVHVGQLILIVVLLLAGYIASRLLERVIEKRLTAAEIRPNAIYAVKRVSFYTLLVVVVMVALSLLNIPLGAFAFVSGAVAIGVGFGAQNVINNFLSGWILLAEQPVRIGDFIELDSHMGVVEYIGNRSTRIRRTDGVHLLIPNSQMLERVVVNWTLIDHQIRTIVRVGVAYGSPVRKVAKLIEEAVVQQPEIMKSEKIRVVLEDFGDNSIVFDAYFWCEVGGERELRQIRSEIRFRIATFFEDNDITIAFPQRDVHLDSLSPVQIELVNADGGGKGGING